MPRLYRADAVPRSQHLAVRRGRILRMGRDDVYGMQVCFIYGAPSRQSAAAINAFIAFPDDHVSATFLGEIRGVTVFGEYPRLAIWVHRTDDLAEDLSVIAHECQHATLHVLERAGVEPSAQSSEAYTYHLEFMMRFCLTALFPPRRKPTARTR